MEQVFLSRRNLLTLLNKLDKRKKGGETACTIIKNDTSHPTFPCSSRVSVTAVEDKDYYHDRSPGVVQDAPGEAN